MAESVQYHLERMLPELEDLEKRGVFSAGEIKAIVKKRTAHEYSIHRRVSRRSDYIRYIEYEKNLELLRRKRKKRLGLDVKPEKGAKLSLSEHSISRRIQALYDNALKKFPGDLNLWIQYIEWCKTTGSSKAMGRIFARAIQLHLSKPVIWILAAKWEFEDNMDMTSARVLLQRGLRINSDSRNLWHEYFKLELLYIEKLKERRRILFGDKPNTSSEASTASGEGGVLKGLKEVENEAAESGEKYTALAEDMDNSRLLIKNDATLDTTGLGVIPMIVYRNAIKAISDDYEFRKGFLHIYRQVGDDTQESQEEVLESIMNDFSDNADALAIVAEAKSNAVDVEDPRFPMLLKETVRLYEEFTQLDNSRIWFLYISYLSSIQERCTEENLDAYLTAMISNLRERCDEKGLADETIYLSWIKSLHTPKDRLTVVTRALTKFPHSPSLWIEKAAASPSLSGSIFKEALSLVGRESDSAKAAANRTLLWVQYLKWLCDGSSATSSEIDAWFRKAMTDSLIGFGRGDEIAIMFLDWTHAVAGLDRVRGLFEWLCSHQKGSRRAIERCIELEIAEGLQMSQDGIRSCRKLFGALCNMAGETCGRKKSTWFLMMKVCLTFLEDVWIRSIDFEINIAKDLSKASELQWRAMKTVLDKDEFVQSFDKLKSSRN
ncbi:U3 snoRNP protein [Dinochytrium kinnereticum]|nr:U3 snoRNP protein [Dinochytrium kinnereticum]